MGVYFGGHWDPNEHILTGFALIPIFAQIAFFGASLPPVYINKAFIGQNYNDLALDSNMLNLEYN